MGKEYKLRAAWLLAALLGVIVGLTGLRPSDTRAAGFSITLNTVGQGTADVDPGPPYTDGQQVTLTATPATGWEFETWELEGNSAWWDSGWDYRVSVNAAAAGYARSNKPAEATLNFTSLLNSIGKTGTLDPNSIRVIEVNQAGDVVDATVPFQFDKASDYNAASKAAGTLVWIMEGNTAAGATRRYHVYFDVTGKGFSPPSFTQQVKFTDGVKDENWQSFKIDTNIGTYFFHKPGGGFSSLNDLNGNDWISWNSASQEAGDFRGIPQLVSPANGGYFHPGRTGVTSTKVSEGPIKATIHAKVTKKEWTVTWEFYPDYALLTVLDTDRDYDYWFLYEGTPGGVLEVGVDYVVRSNGAKTLAGISWSGDLVNEEWAYVADPNVGRAIYFAMHEDDTEIDSYDQQAGKMTKLGFGRTGLQALIDGTNLPREFTFGLMDETEYEDAKPIIYNAYKDLNVTVGSAEARAGSSLGSNNPAQFTVTGEHVITAIFVPLEYTLSAGTEGQGTVTRDPMKATYGHGEEVTLTAVPANGWIFDQWLGDVTGTTNPVVVTMDEDKIITARFLQTFTVDTTVVGQGSVELDPDQDSYIAGQSVELTAVPAGGWSFTGWSGGVTGSENPKTVVVNQNLDVTATFAQANYTLDVNKVGNGTLDWTPVQGSYAFGEVVTLTATADSGWAFLGWSGDFASFDNPYVLTMTQSTVLTGTFATQQNYQLQIQVVGNGDVSKDPDLAEYPTGTVVSLLAQPDPGWRFTGWSNGLTGDANPAQIQMTGNKTVVANFEADAYPLNITIVGQGQVNPIPDKPSYTLGEQVQLTAVPVSGWKFDGWAGAVNGATNPISLTIQTTNDVLATFSEAGDVSLTTDVVGDGFIQLEPNKTEFAFGENVKLTAVPGPGFVFAGWSGAVTGNANPVTLTMDNNKSVTATFIEPTDFFSDNFNTCELDPRWKWVDPLGDGLLETDFTHVNMTVPPDKAHLIYNGPVNAPRLMQPADNVDFGIEVKFDSPVDAKFQQQGIVIEESATRMLRFDFYFDGEDVRIFGATLLSGRGNQKFNHVIDDPDDARFLRVVRQGDGWTTTYSSDGLTWQEPANGTFKQVMNVTKVGFFVGNSAQGNNPVPGHTAEVDYFANLASPPPPDGPILTVDTSGGGQVNVTPSLASLRCGQTATLTAVPGFGYQFDNWTGDLSGSQNPATLLLDNPKSVTANFESGELQYLMLPVIIKP